MILKVSALFGRHTDEMSRNIKMVLQPILSALAEKCSEFEDKAILETYEIYISEEDYYLIESNTIRNHGLFQPSFSAIFALYECGGAQYLVEAGMPELSSKRGSDIGYMGVDNDDNQALFFLFVNQSGLQVKESVTPGDIYNTVFTEDNKRDRIPGGLLRPFFPEVNIYKIDSAKVALTLPFDEYCLKQLTLKYICAVFQEKAFTPVNLSEDAITLYDKLSENADHLIPIDNLVQSILAYRWNFVFLDLYRCLERLYVIGWVLDYSEAFDSLLDKEEVHAKLIERFVGHHEDEIIRFLFTKLDDMLLAELDPIRGEKKQADFIYDLRNSIVHYQTNDVTHTDGEWNIISIFLLKAIDKLYTDLAEDIRTLGNKEFKKDKSGGA